MSADMTLVLFLGSLMLVVAVGVALLVFVVHPHEKRRLQAQQEAAPEIYAPCPACGSQGARPATWTWWGGALGPRLLTHVKCVACGAVYNGKTGKPNTVAIIVYSVVAFIVFYGLFSVLGRVLIQSLT